MKDTDKSPQAPCAITEKLILAASLSDELDQIYELNLRNKGVEKIENLSKVVRLRSLDLSCNNIKKIENLQSCGDLKELKLFHNAIATVDSLSKNTQLQTLLLHSNKISKIEESTFKSLVKLTTLRLDYNNILKIEGLAYSRNLTYLDLSNNKLSRIEGLDTLVNLEDLYLNDNILGMIENLSRSAKLREIRLSHNRISSGAGLPKTLSQLSILRLDHNIIPNLATFYSSKSISELFVNNNEISSLLLPKTETRKKTSLAELFPNLEILDASNNKIADLEGVFALENLQELMELVLVGNPICTSPNYPYCIWARLTQLQLLDGAPRDPSIDYANAETTIRPSTASKRAVTTSPISTSPSPPSSSRSASPHLSPSHPISYHDYAPSSRPITGIASSRPITPGSSRPTTPGSFRPGTAQARPTTPYSARPPSALASGRPASVLSQAVRGAGGEEGVGSGIGMPLMAPATSMSKVQRMPSLLEIEQQFDRFKDQLTNFSTSALQRTRYIRSVMDQPNTLGKQFVNLTPRATNESLHAAEPDIIPEPVSPWMAPVLQSPRPKTPNLETPHPRHPQGKKSRANALNNVDVDSDYVDSDNDLEVRAVLERNHTDGLDATLQQVGSNSRPGEAQTKMSRGSADSAERKSKSRYETTEGTVAPTPSGKPPTRTRAERSTDGPAVQSKSQTTSRTPDTATKRKPKPTVDLSVVPTPLTSTYVPSDINSFVNSVLNKVDRDDEEFTPRDDTTSYLKPTKPPSKAPPKCPTSSRVVSSAKPRAPTPPKTPTTPQPTMPTTSAPSMPTTVDIPIPKTRTVKPTKKSKENPTSKTSTIPTKIELEIEPNQTMVPKLALPISNSTSVPPDSPTYQFSPLSTPADYDGHSTRQEDGNMGEDEYNGEDGDVDYMDDKVAEKRGQPTQRELTGYKQFHTPRRTKPKANLGEEVCWNISSVIT